MINVLFRLKGLFGYKVNCRVIVYVFKLREDMDVCEFKEKFKKHFDTEKVLICIGYEGKPKIEVTYY